MHLITACFSTFTDKLFTNSEQYERIRGEFLQLHSETNESGAETSTIDQPRMPSRPSNKQSVVI